jgi:hypothetical protein
MGDSKRFGAWVGRRGGGEEERGGGERRRRGGEGGQKQRDHKRQDPKTKTTPKQPQTNRMFTYT